MFKKSLVPVLLTLLTKSPLAHAQEPTVSSILERADASQWRAVEPNNVLKITLATGSAYIELNPYLAPKHTSNIKLLAQQGFYKELNVYRFVEGFVAQGGDASGKKVITKASKTLPAEFYLTTKAPVAITELDNQDGYAPITGFLDGFAVAQNKNKTETWQVHCNGIFAMARGNDINSGGTEFYVTIGNSQRYLDRNITVFGRVLEGMQHFNRLNRQANDKELLNPITDIQVLADIAEYDSSQFKVMRTDSTAFKALIEARKNRSEAWFVETPNYIDVCAMPIPTQRVNKA